MVLTIVQSLAGKATLAGLIPARFVNRAYLNRDVVSDRVRLLRDPCFFVAVELLRAASMWNDRGDGPFALHFVRNTETVSNGGHTVLVAPAWMWLPRLP